MSFRILTTSSLASLLLLSCAGKKPEQEQEDSEEKKIPKSQVVGRIASVSARSEFVLIQKYGAGKLPTQGIYQTVGDDGRSASIRPSGERVRDFYAADITDGEVKSGDAVIFRVMTPEAPDLTLEDEIEESQETSP